MPGFELSTPVTFHGVSYILTVSGPEGEDSVTLELEHETEGTRWSNTFTAKYVEEMTRKTGNFKRFGVLVKMLVAAVNRESDSVFIDLLTYADLETLRHRKAGRPAGAAASASSSSTFRHSTRRYVILTYAVEWDRVHYPLQLNHEETPSAAALQRTIRRLRGELHQHRLRQDASADELSGEVVRLQRENDALRVRVQQLSANASIKAPQGKGGPGASAGGKRLDELETALDAEVKLRTTLESSLERHRITARAEIKRLRQEVERLGGNSHSGSSRGVPDGRGGGGSDARQYVLEQQLRDMADEMAALKETNMSLRSKTRDLTRQLAVRGGDTRGRTTRSSPRGTRRAASPSGRPDSPRYRRPRSSTAGSVGSRGSVSSAGSGARRKKRATSSASPARSTSRGRSPGRGATRTSKAATTSSPAARARRSRSPSPGRFDPTAYEEERRRKLADMAERKRLRNSPSPSPRRSRSRSRSVDRASHGSGASSPRDRPRSTARPSSASRRKAGSSGTGGLPPRRSREGLPRSARRLGDDRPDPDSPESATRAAAHALIVAATRGSDDDGGHGGGHEPLADTSSHSASPPSAGKPLPRAVTEFQRSSQSPSPSPGPDDEKQVIARFEATTMEINSIDERLDALRDFVQSIRGEGDEA